MNPRLAWSALLLALVCALQIAAIWKAPQRYLPSHITLQLTPGASAALGRGTLAAPQAAAQQFVVRRDLAGHWWLRNLYPAQAAVLIRGGQRLHTGSIALVAGQRVQAGAAVLDVLAADAGRTTLHDGRHRWDYDGALLLRDGQPQPACATGGMAARLTGWWNRSAPGVLAVPRPVAVGGHLLCGNLLAVPGLDTGNVTLARARSGTIALTVRATQPVLLMDRGRWHDLARREHALGGLDALALGRTVYSLALDNEALRLRPSVQVELFAQARAPLPGPVAWTWSERSLWQAQAPSLLAGSAALALFFFAAMLGLRLAAPVRSLAACAAIAAQAAIPAVALMVLVMQRSGAAPGTGWALLLAWAALWHALLWSRRLSLLGAVAVLLLGSGLLVQLEMGLGAPDTAWLRHVDTSCVLLALGLPLGLLLLQGLARNQASQRATEWLLVALAATALAGLVLQVAAGNETGVFNIQPVEFAKFALAALSAHCLALATGSRSPGRRGWRHWLRIAAPALLLALLLAVALIQVDDYSPLILLLVWAAGLLVAWRLAAGRRLQASLTAALCCALLLGAAGLRHAGPGLGAAGFYTERFQVWADPTAHPHTGGQMLLGARAIADGGWLGTDGLLGLAALGGAAGEALRIPAVQDDFAPAFLVNRHGLAGALLLWLLQAALLAALLHAAASAWQGAVRAGDFRRAWLGRFQCFFLAGGAAFLAGHFLLSWGTNLALLPIMGQPMSFLSSGGSHLLFFICPLLAFGMASVQSFEES